MWEIATQVCLKLRCCIGHAEAEGASEGQPSSAGLKYINADLNRHVIVAGATSAWAAT